MSVSKVAVTGGNGKIGSAILNHLADAGYETVNIARGSRREEVSDEYITTNLLDAGETYGAIAKTDIDAVIHMGTIPHPNSDPDFRVYESNVMSAAHVIEAGDALDLEAICLPSSINAIGSEHQERNAKIQYLPVDEAHDRTPDDSYGIAKHAMEVTADGIARRPSADLTISSIRYPWVPNDDEVREMFADADRSLAALPEAHTGTTRDVLFSYLHIDDAASIARRAIEADHDGHEVFWAVAADTTAAVPTRTLIDEYFPNVEVREELTGTTSLIDISKAKRMLGWEPQRSWRDI
ncbi:NAD-dependent epimerase/dehydratase family protein [Halovenus marina]|uniref:NAD-dependent epimerase/dehydratase family protein n=1 Tax=Halovenus marina TaxID=3396621 RepID=UPI003F55808C